MKPYTFTDNRSLMINEKQTDQPQESAETEQDEAFEANYPRELNKRGLLVSLGISVALVGVLIIALL